MRNTEDKVARVASINSIITQIDQHIKYVESIPGTIKNIINNLNDIKDNDMWNENDMITPNPDQKSQYTESYLKYNLVPYVKNLMQPILKALPELKPEDNKAMYQDLDTINKYFQESERSLDRFQQVLDRFVTAAAGEEKDQQKAQNALSKIKEACQFVLRDFDKFITAIQDFFDKVQEKVFGIPRARLEDTPQGLEQGKENEQNNNRQHEGIFPSKSEVFRDSAEKDQ